MNTNNKRNIEGIMNAIIVHKYAIIITDLWTHSYASLMEKKTFTVTAVE